MHWIKANGVENAVYAIRRSGNRSFHRYSDGTAEYQDFNGKKGRARPETVEGYNDWQPFLVSPRIYREHRAHPALLAACEEALEDCPCLSGGFVTGEIEPQPCDKCDRIRAAIDLAKPK